MSHTENDPALKKAAEISALRARLSELEEDVRRIRASIADLQLPTAATPKSIDALSMAPVGKPLDESR